MIKMESFIDSDRSFQSLVFFINSTKRKEVEKGDKLLSLGKYRQFSIIKRGNEKEISKKRKQQSEAE